MDTEKLKQIKIGHPFRYGPYNCYDFKTQKEAQALYEAAGPGNPHRLDPGQGQRGL
jgi:hypothetical protein